MCSRCRSWSKYQQNLTIIFATTKRATFLQMVHVRKCNFSVSSFEAFHCHGYFSSELYCGCLLLKQNLSTREYLQSIIFFPPKRLSFLYMYKKYHGSSQTSKTIRDFGNFQTPISILVMLQEFLVMLLIFWTLLDNRNGEIIFSAYF